MSSYPRAPRWQLHHHNNLDVADGLPSLLDRSVDIVITDPPYGSHVHASSRRGVTGSQERPGKGAPIQCQRELGFPPLAAIERAEIARQLSRIVKRWVLVFSDHEGSTRWRDDLEAAGLEYVRTCIWIKGGCTPQFRGDRPAAGHECIVVAHQTRNGRTVPKRWNGGGRRGVYQHSIVLDRARAGKRVHTTQKPLSLMRDLVSDFTEPGELVCDPYAGSGTTGIACMQLSRRFLGWERDSTYAAIARRRLAGLRAVPIAEQIEMFR